MATSSGGGAAAAGGNRFELQVGAWLAAHVLAEARLHAGSESPWPPTAGRLTHVGLQTGYPVDDIGAFTSNHGFIAIQAKKKLGLGTAETSPLAEALDQAVRMFRDGPPVQGTERAWDPLFDRIVIATDTDAPKAVRDDLAIVVKRLAKLPSWGREDQITSNAGQRTALQVFTQHLQRLWRLHTGSEVSPDEVRAFCSVVHVVAFDLRPVGRDLKAVYAELRAVMADASRIDSAWRSLFTICQDLSADREFADAASLRGCLAADGIDLIKVTHTQDEAGPVFTPEAVLHGPLTSGPMHDRVVEADRKLTADPLAAADLYRSAIAELREGGYVHEAANLQPRLTRALRQSGQHDAAIRAAIAVAWEPLRRGEAPDQFPDHLRLMDGGIWTSEAPSPAAAAVSAVLRYEAGDMTLRKVAECIAAVRDDDERAGELLLWLGEEAAAAGNPTVFEDLCGRALVHAEAAGAEAAEFNGRIRIAVADCRRDWSPLLATIEADCGPALYVLALARHGQAMVRGNDLATAVERYEQAVARGTAEQMFAEVRTWLYDLRNLRMAWAGHSAGYETHYTAQSLPRSRGLLSMFEGKEHLHARALEALAEEKLDRAHRTFMRLRHRMSAGAALATSRQCESGLGAVLHTSDPTSAVKHYLRGANHKKATELQRQQPDAALEFDRSWFGGPPWQSRATYEFVGAHGDLVREAGACDCFDLLSSRLVTTGTLRDWASVEANEALLKALAAVAWASSREAAEALLTRLAPIAQTGGLRFAVESHVDLLLVCARVHPDLVAVAARQFADLLCVNERAVPAMLSPALKRLAPESAYLRERLSQVVMSTPAPWLFPVLERLGARTPAVIRHAEAALDTAAKPRTYTPGRLEFGSGLVGVARFAHLGNSYLRKAFVAAMLTIAQEPREPHVERRAAIDAIAVVLLQSDGSWLDATLREGARDALQPIADGKELVTDNTAFGWLQGSPRTLALAANRLLLILAGDEQERGSIARTLLLSLMDSNLEEPGLLQNALAQAPPDTFQHDLLALATSRSPAIRAFAAHCWARIADSDNAIGHRLAHDPVGVVRLALAHGVVETDRPDADDIRTRLKDDCRFTVREAVRSAK